jgi:hypothetical protein
VTAELSIHDVADPLHVRPISEQPDESEHPSSPQGTIGEAQPFYDIMSEHVYPIYGKFSTKQMVEEEDRDLSNLAGKSEYTKFSLKDGPSQIIPFQENPRNIQSFLQAYDRLYGEFRSKLAQEFSQARSLFLQDI